MIFNSYIFWVFFAIVFVLYRLLPHRGQNYMLLAASYIFYGYWDWRYLFLMLFSTVIDYFAAIGIGTSQSPRRRKAILIASICIQLSLLGMFKYYGFFSHELSNMLTSFGLPAPLPVINFLLPVGISFYTFQTMSYVIDVYRGDFKYSKSFIDFALFVSFFPHLVAGPLVRAGKLMPQMRNPRVRRPEDFREGLYHVAYGMFKKVFVGDNMAAIANAIFQTDPANLSGLEVLVGIYAFAFQIYADFSGYSSIAQGVAKWLNVDLTTNFKLPYFAVSPSDFWRRWHISLSTWFRDYVYIPLGGNRRGEWAMYRNLVITTTLSGLWHGANWTFILWGLFHGLLICIYRLFEGGEEKAPKEFKGTPEAAPALSLGGRLLRIALMFHLVCLGWLMFRAESMSQVSGMLYQLASDFRVTPFALSGLAMIAFYAGPLMAYEFWLEMKHDLLKLTRIHWVMRGLAYSYCASMLWFFPPPVSNVFIYFQF